MMRTSVLATLALALVTPATLATPALATPPPVPIATPGPTAEPVTTHPAPPKQSTASDAVQAPTPAASPAASPSAAPPEVVATPK